MNTIIRIALSISLLTIIGCVAEVDSTVNVSIEGEGSVTDGKQLNCPGQCEAEYKYLSNFTKDVTLNASPSLGYDFFGWDRCGMEETCTLTLRAYCTDPLPPKGVIKPCLNFAGTNINRHAIFVAEGSILNYDVYGHNKCLINTSGQLKCWPATFADTVPASVSNPTEVFLGSGSSCVKDDSVLNCWGSHFVEDVPNFESVDLVDVHQVTACATENDEAVCWTSSTERIIDGPSLNNISNLELLGSVYSDVCADHSEGRSCWGAIKRLATIPETIDADIYAISDTSTCAYSSMEGLRCWGEISGANEVSDQLDNPVTLGVGWHHLCALDSQGLRCWKNGAPIDLPPSLSDTTDFKQNGDLLCTLDSLGNECWKLGSEDATQRTTGDLILAGVSQRGSCSINGQTISCGGDKHFKPVELANDYQTPISQPTALAANNNGFCIAGENGVDCQFHVPLHNLVAPPEDLVNVTEVAMGPGEVCAVHDGDVACWGTRARGLMDVPLLSNPRDLKIGFNHACAIDDTGLNCWGWITQEDEPPQTEE